jgi:hypothetical protein
MKLLSGLVVQMTAVMLNHMYTSASEATTAEALDTDYLILDWLKSNGYCSSEWITIQPSGDPDQVPQGLHNADGSEVVRVHWRKDYHAYLLRTMVRAAHALGHLCYCCVQGN